jgi:hypothetical protein
MPTPSQAIALQHPLQLPVNKPDPDDTVSILGPVEDAFVWLHLHMSEGLDCWTQWFSLCRHSWAHLGHSAASPRYSFHAGDLSTSNARIHDRRIADVVALLANGHPAR